MPHIHTKPGEHDFCASAFIIRLNEDEPRLLLHKHKKLGIYLQFGGHVELNENPWQALRHELLEESGYELGQLKLLQPPHSVRRLSGIIVHPLPVVLMTHNFDATHKHTDIEYAFTTTETPRHAISEAESKDVRAFSRAELEDKAFPIPDNVREIGLFIFDICLKYWERVDTSSFEL